MFVLSLFPGIDLLGTGFEQEGYSVVRGPDLIWGQDVTAFHVPAGKFDGIIAGTPCQDFSRSRRSPPTGYGELMLDEFRRLLTEARPKWFLLENVERVPDISIDGYSTQRLDLRASECGSPQRRLRHFQFGHYREYVIQLERSAVAESQKCCLATEGSKGDRRDWSTFCQLQGLPPNFDLPGWPIAFKYRAVGNGVPIPMARTVARAIKKAKPLNKYDRLCICMCGRTTTGRQKAATATCRKRMETRRKRDAAAV